MSAGQEHRVRAFAGGQPHRHPGVHAELPGLQGGGGHHGPGLGGIAGAAYHYPFTAQLGAG
jgi:hypothetical protein